MKFGFRTPSLKKRLAARTSLKRYVRHSLGVKAPRGFGIVTNPRKALCNKIYRKTTVGIGAFPSGHINKISSKKISLGKKFETAALRNFNSYGKIVCTNCGADSWAIIRRRILFWTVAAFYCEHCSNLEKVFRLRKSYTLEQLLDDFVKETSNQNLSAWKLSGVVKTLKYYSVEDDSVCDECKKFNGSIIKIEDGEIGENLPPLKKCTKIKCRCYFRPENVSIN